MVVASGQCWSETFTDGRAMVIKGALGVRDDLSAFSNICMLTLFAQERLLVTFDPKALHHILVKVRIFFCLGNQICMASGSNGVRGIVVVYQVRVLSHMVPQTASHAFPAATLFSLVKACYQHLVRAACSSKLPLLRFHRGSTSKAKENA